MKCVNCGGEVDSQSVECPYCGSKNEEGIRFQKLVSEKIEKNKLLEKMLYKQQTPELMNAALSKVILVQFVLCVLFIAIATYMVTETDEICESIGARPAECTQNVLAQRYRTEFLNEYEGMNPYAKWSMHAEDFMECWLNGKQTTDFARTTAVENIITDAKDLMHNKELTEEERAVALAEVEVIFVDIIGLTEEEMALFEQDDPQLELIHRLPDETKEQLEQIVLDRMEEKGR